MKTAGKTPRRRQGSQRTNLAWVLAPPSIEDLIRLFGAWRLCILGGLAGALVGAAVYAVAPPPFRARATVNVDFHLEQAWPRSSDREHFYYLERETRKLVEIAFSDQTLGAVAQAVPGLTIQELRAGAAQLSQPGNGGWHFFGFNQDPNRAAMIASTWARAFREHLMRQVQTGEPAALERFITADVTQAEPLSPGRSLTQGTYMLSGALAFLSLAALALLLIHPRA
jgi:hypothetical protein